MDSDWSWMIDHVPQVNCGMTVIRPFLATFKEFPPSQKAASLTLDDALAKMAAAGTGR